MKGRIVVALLASAIPGLARASNLSIDTFHPEYYGGSNVVQFDCQHTECAMIFWSSNRSSDLKRINSVLGGNTSMSISGLMDKSKSVAEEQLYDLIERDQSLQKIMAKHGATRSTLKEIYWALMRAGAGQWESGHWVAASAIAFETTLDFVLTSTKNATKTDRNTLETIAFKLIIYFENGAVGPLR